MNYSGSLTGLAVERAGKKKVVQELSIEDNSLKIIKKLPESIIGLIGEHKPSLRK